MTGLDSGIVRLYRAIADSGLQVMVGGGIAAIFFGEPRTTLDVDMIIDAQAPDAERIIAAIDTEQFYVPPLDTIRSELARGSRGHFNIIEFATGMKADLYPAGDDPLIRFGLSHASVRDLAGVPIVVAPATYVISMKLRYFMISQQDKHLRDIRGILALSPDEVDMTAVDRWAMLSGASDAWRRCQSQRGEE